MQTEKGKGVIKKYKQKSHIPLKLCPFVSYFGVLCFHIVASHYKNLHHIAVEVILTLSLVLKYPKPLSRTLLSCK